MLFDRLCGIVEKQYPNAALQRLLRAARIFEFPGRIHEKAEARDWVGFGGSEFVMENFFLPFPVVAIEDTASCIVLADDQPNQKGLNCPRVAIEIMDMRAPIEEFGLSRDNVEHREKWEAAAHNSDMPLGASSVTVTKLLGGREATAEERAQKPGGTGLVFEGVSDISFLATTDHMLIDPVRARFTLRQSGIEREHGLAAIANAVAALEEVMYFNTPNHFVVERSPARVRQGKRSKLAPLIPRSEERPSYILLKAHEIRQRFGIPDGPVNERKAPTPHARRRHYRTLSSDRYTTRQGEVIVVSASWVGPTEGTYKGRGYRVCLDL